MVKRARVIAPTVRAPSDVLGRKRAARNPLARPGGVRDGDRMCESIDDLLELEHQGWRARCDGTAALFYGSVMSDDSRVVLGDGVVLDRSQALRVMARAQPWVRYELAQPRFLSLGPEAAALIYRARAYSADGQPVLSAAMSSVYVRHEGALRLALYQQSHELAA
jgi:hypothetical protein